MATVRVIRFQREKDFPYEDGLFIGREFDDIGGIVIDRDLKIVPLPVHSFKDNRVTKGVAVFDIWNI